MPTPFYHLATANALLAHPALDADVRAYLGAARGAFLFGNTAPDVQMVSGQTREATHFFDFPPDPARPAVQTLLQKHPELANAAALAPMHAAFIAGYLAHLALDELWLINIFGPYFGPNAPMGADFPERLLLHNVVRTHLDLQDVPGLHGWAGLTLRQAVPNAWLPFTLDGHLATWRDMLADQLVPQAPVRTVEIFAARMRVPPATIEALLTPDELSTRVWCYLPENTLRDFRNAGVAVMRAVIEPYLARAARVERAPA